MLVSSQVRRVDVTLEDGSVLTYAGRGTIRAEAVPVGDITPSVKAWADGSAPRVEWVAVQLRTRDDA